MADINVTINPAPSVSAQVSAAPEVDVIIGEGIPKHAVTHAPGGSDSLEAYYATTGSLAYVSGLTTGISSTGYLTGYVSKSETGDFYPSSNPSGFITGVDLSGYVTGDVVRPSQTGNFITNSQTGQFVSDSETGAFYPASNPSGFITGVDLSAYVTGDVVRPSETGSFITTSQTGQFVADSETGAFYPSSNPSGFITGVDLSAYVTGDVVRPSQTGAFLTTGSADTRYALQSQTGNFVTTSQTGQFVGDSETGAFYPASNPSGFITGVDLSNYVTGAVVRPSETGSFITTSQTGQFVSTGATGNFVTGSVVRPSETGAFLTTGAADARYALQSQTGVFVTTGQTGDFITVSQTGQFYSASNPSGYITGVDLSSYATTGYVTGVSGYLQTQINNFSSSTGNYVTLTGNQDISGLKDFQTRPTVLDVPVLLSGEPVDIVHLYAKNDESFILNKGQPVYIGGANGSNPLIKMASNTGEFSSSKTIGLLAQTLNPNDLGYVITEGALEGFDTSAGAAGDPMWLGPTGQILYGTGNKPYGLNNLVYLGVVLRSQSNNGKVYVQIQNGFEIEELHNVYALNPSNKDSLLYDSASGAWFSRQINTGDVSGISNYVLKSETGSFITTSQTGQFVGDSETGAFLTTGAADGRYALQSQTGDFITTSQTGAFAAAANTGAFLTTGAADSRYYSLANGQSISGYAITGYNDAITGMSVTGDSTKTITLFQRDGTTVSANFTDNSGSSVSNVVFTTGDQTISGIKTFYSGIIIYPSGGSDTNTFVLKNTIDPSNTSVNALVIAPNNENNRRLYFGEAGKNFYSINLQNVGRFESFPSLIQPDGDFTISMNWGANLYLRHFPSQNSAILPILVSEEDSYPEEGYFNFVSNSKNGLSGKAFLINTKYNRSGGSLIEAQITGLSKFIVDISGNLSGNGGSFNQRPTVNSIGVALTGDLTGYVGKNETGIFITTGQTGSFVANSQTGAFLTTGAADGRYYTLSNGQSISGYAITGFNDAVTGITVTGDTTKTITLFQRDGTTLTANFTDNGGSGSSDTGYLTGYVSKTETGNIAVGTIGLVLDGNGSTISTGYKTFTATSFSGEIESYTILADRTGSIVIDVWKDSYGGYPLVSGDSICPTNKVTLSNDIKNTDSTLTSWTKPFAAGDVFGFNVDSVSGVQKIFLNLKVKKA